ncbi:MAG: hypothetical protein ABIP65_11750 [Vicinamibacterales bacterium]
MELLAAIVLALASGLFSTRLLAHGDLHAEIAAATARIARDPQNKI